MRVVLLLLSLLLLCYDMQVCRRATGVTVKCAFGLCAATFHPLCGRARGWYLAIRAGGKGGSYLYKAYCAAHSDAQRNRDREAAERTAMLAQGVSVCCIYILFRVGLF